jgi:hypothetical protein
MSIITPWNLSLLLKLNDFVEVSSSKELVRWSGRKLQISRKKLCTI